MAPRKDRSSLTPRSTATYIGSTPNPPRRIRQHNGELAQGAYKTKSNRPWVMQMIVHGFPSKLAALQFEWAWQHPHVSRHLRDEDKKPIFAKSGRGLKANIRILRVMLSTHPYRMWPLHVKLFTDDAVRGWRDATKDIDELPLPRGFGCIVELEGVDGKSGKPGSGRQGPIDVKDEPFTSIYLAKHTALVASNRSLTCSICSQPLFYYPSTPLATTLCPTPSCTSVSHLTCLSNDFLHSQTADDNDDDDEYNNNNNGLCLIPRGGECRSCGKYVLWGDLIRGCYRRSTSSDLLCLSDEEDNTPAGSGCDVDDDVPFPATPLTPAAAASHPSTPAKKGIITTPRPKKTPKRRHEAAVVIIEENSGEGEFFNFDAGINSASTSGNDNEDGDDAAFANLHRKPGYGGNPNLQLPVQRTPRLVLPEPSLPTTYPATTPKSKGKQKAHTGPGTSLPRRRRPCGTAPRRQGTARRNTSAVVDENIEDSSEGEFFDLRAALSDREDFPWVIGSPYHRPIHPQRPLPTSSDTMAGPSVPPDIQRTPGGRRRPPGLSSPQKKRNGLVCREGEVDFFVDVDDGLLSGRRRDDDRGGHTQDLIKAISLLSISSSSDGSPPEVGKAFLRTSKGAGGSDKQRGVEIIELSD